MSLLMDALKKAEQAKQQGQQAAAQPPTELALEPVASAEVQQAAGETLPELPSKLEELDSQFLPQPPASTAVPNGGRAPATRSVGGVPPSEADRRRIPVAGGRPATPADKATPPRPARPGGDADLADREAVRNTFAVKQPQVSRRFAVAATLFTLIAGGGVGAYFWYQLRPAPGLFVQAPGGAGIRPPASPVAPPPAPAEPAVAQVPAPAAGEPPADAPQASVPVPRLAAARPAAKAVDAPVAPIRVTTAAEGKPSQTALDGYDAFQAGNLGAARAAYEKALRGDPWNVEALNGLAATAQREGRSDQAEALYQRVLEADPRDAQAQAALLGLRLRRGELDLVSSESRIKGLLAAQPEAPALSFALGNLYARQSRWSEAQQAYFRAASSESGNPDYLFNLAVSLDQLHQGKLAAQYYRQALKAAEDRPAAFDPAQVAARLRELQP